MTDHRDIYRGHAEQYDELVRAEDAQGNLGPALDAIHPLRGAVVLEVGAGTGRITRLLLERATRHVTATDIEPAMLATARRSLDMHGDRVRFEVADARNLPVASSAFDLAIAGWVFGHFRSWMPEGWKAEVGAALDELSRALRPGGTVVVVETLGTGSVEPAPPSHALAEYYAWLESDRGFARRAIRTDYAFDSVEEAARVTGFFFGPPFADRVRSEMWRIVPECTGIWSLHQPGPAAPYRG